MSIPAAILLAVVQGLTEFLPVSSSGHLAIAQHFLPGFHEPGVVYEVSSTFAERSQSCWMGSGPAPREPREDVLERS